MKRVLLFITLVALCAACQTLRKGDLLFHVVAQDNQITEVTSGQIDHVAIYAGSGEVVEAIPRKGVTTTPLDTLLHREDGYYLRGRVTGIARDLSVTNARQYLGLPYDSLYLPTTDAIYCSELVQIAYVDRMGKQLFGTIPMSFHDSTGQITSYWQRFYAQHGMDVPEKQPGTNPAELSKRQIVKILGELR